MQQMHRSFGIETSRPKPEAKERSSAVGYGLGLFVQADARLGRLIGHSGGLPGWGSHMRWFPDRGLGLVALGNVTYARVGEACLEAFEVLADLDALPAPRPVEPSPELTWAVRDLLALLDDWDEERARSLFADNVLLDEDASHRAGKAASLREEHGSLAPAGPLEATSALSGSRSLAGGRVTLEVAMNAQVPPRIQWYELRANAPSDT
jgi:CubicO group peptidase (beta-lactamase class C family)